MTKTAPPKIQIECFLDLICPFSCKMYKMLYEKVLPTLDEDISIAIHHVIQPWHPQGTMVHEAALAVKQISPQAYPGFVNDIYTNFSTGKFKDEDTWKKTRLEIYDDLLELLPTEVDKNAVKALLMPTGAGGNEGNKMTQEIKWACKFHRARGVHVTPTVFVNGLEAGAVSSGWSEDQWKKFLAEKGNDFFQNA